MSVAQTNVSQLPAEWIDRLFMKLATTFARGYLEFWRGVDIDEAKRDWAARLADLTMEEIARGLERAQREFTGRCPNLAQFRAFCRSDDDYEEMYMQAVRCAYPFYEGAWPSKAVFHAAYRFGTERLRNSNWMSAQKRWKHVVDAVMTELPNLSNPPSPAVKRLDAKPDLEQYRRGGENSRRLLNQIRAANADRVGRRVNVHTGFIRPGPIPGMHEPPAAAPAAAETAQASQDVEP